MAESYDDPKYRYPWAKWDSLGNCWVCVGCEACAAYGVHGPGCRVERFVSGAAVAFGVIGLGEALRNRTATEHRAQAAWLERTLNAALAAGLAACDVYREKIEQLREELTDVSERLIRRIAQKNVDIVSLREALTKIRVTAKLGTSMLGVRERSPDLASKDQAVAVETLEAISELARRALDDGGFA